MRFSAFCIMLFTMTLSSHAQTAHQRYDECLKKEQDQLMCAIKAAPADLQEEIKKASEAAEERITKSGDVEDAFAAVVGTYSVVARRLSDLTKPFGEKSERLLLQSRLSAESAELAEIVSKAVAMTNTFEAKLQKETLTTKKILDETARHTEAIMNLTNEASIRYRGNSIGRNIQALADKCTGEVSVCQQEAIDSISSQVFIWSMGLDSVKNEMYEHAVDDLLALLEEYEKKK